MEVSAAQRRSWWLATIGTHTAEFAVFHALRVYGSATDAALVSRMREIAKNDRRTPKFSTLAVIRARRVLSKAGLVERADPGVWCVNPGLRCSSFEDAHRWVACRRDPRKWLEAHGVRVERGYAVLYKAVKADFVSAHGTRYRPGDRPLARDWHNRPTCDGGLFFWPTIEAARRYMAGGTTRYVACRVSVDLLVTIGMDKCKAPRCTVLREVALAAAA